MVDWWVLVGLGFDWFVNLFCLAWCCLDLVFFAKLCLDVVWYCLLLTHLTLICMLVVDFVLLFYGWWLFCFVLFDIDLSDLCLRWFGFYFLIDFVCLLMGFDLCWLACVGLWFVWCFVVVF